ncbi:hypothetical protein [Micromonospora parva]
MFGLVLVRAVMPMNRTFVRITDQAALSSLIQRRSRWNRFS